MQLEKLSVFLGADHAPMERFFRSLKGEWIPEIGYASFAEAERIINQYIVAYYSQFRPHQHNGGLPPNKAEIKWGQTRLICDN